MPLLVDDILRFTYVENRGAAFGLLQDQTAFFVFVGILVIGVIAASYRYLPRSGFMLHLALGLQLGGAHRQPDRPRPPGLRRRLRGLRLSRQLVAGLQRGRLGHRDRRRVARAEPAHRAQPADPTRTRPPRAMSRAEDVGPALVAPPGRASFDPAPATGHRPLAPDAPGRATLRPRERMTQLATAQLLAVSAPHAGQRLDGFLAPPRNPRVALPLRMAAPDRPRLGHRQRPTRPRRPAPHRWRSRPDRRRPPTRVAARARPRPGRPLPRRLRGPVHDRRRQARRRRRPPCPRQRAGHARQRAARALSGARRRRLRSAPRHRPPPRQGHLRRAWSSAAPSPRPRTCSARCSAAPTEKRYLLLVRGNIGEDEGLIDAPIGRDPRNRQRMAVRAGGSLRPDALLGARTLRRLDPGRRPAADRSHAPAAGALRLDRSPGRRRLHRTVRAAYPVACPVSSSTPACSACAPPSTTASTPSSPSSRPT